MTILIPEGFSNGHLRWALAGDLQEMTTAIGFSSAPGTEPEDEAELFNVSVSIGGLCTPANVCNEYTYKGVRVERMTATGLVVTEVDSALVGTKVGSCLPSNCSILVDKVTSAGGKAFRGRMYFPPLWLPETQFDHNGFTAPANVASLQTMVGLWRLDMIDKGIPPVLFHSNPALTPTFITSLRPQAQIATQRERMR